MRIINMARKRVIITLIITVGVLLVGLSSTASIARYDSHLQGTQASSDQLVELTEIGQLATGELAVDVDVKGDLAFVADYSSGLHIINISDPSNPVEISSYSEVGPLHQSFIDLDNDLVYLADQTAGLRIIDVSDPSDPEQIGQFHNGGEIMGVFVSENLAFLSDFDDGIEVVNVSDPTQPVEISTYSEVNH